MPRIIGLPNATFDMKKALTAAANYGCPMLWADGITDDAPDVENFQGVLHFKQSDLAERYRELSPKGIVDLVVIGCPQASVSEARSTAAFVRSRMELGEKIQNHRLWVFMSSHNYDIIGADGTLDILEEGGALVLKDTCPEVTPYNRANYNHLLTNSLKAEHYLTSGLNKMPTSVATIEDCVAHAFDPTLLSAPRPTLKSVIAKTIPSSRSMYLEIFMLMAMEYLVRKTGQLEEGHL